MALIVRGRGVRPAWLALAIAGVWCVESHARPEPPKRPETAMPITAAPEPVPALRWRLMPELRETTPGNAATLYYRSFAPEWMGNVRTQKMADELDKAANMPLGELREFARKPESGIGWVRQSSMLKEVDRASRRQYCDWDLIGRVREEGVGLLLPDQQSFREFARMLAVRARLELADGDYTAAVRTLQTGLMLGRNVSDAPTLIQSLVGTAISAVMFSQVEEWVRTSGSPNLYWALTNLPRPFIDLRKPFQGERLFLDNLLPGFRDAIRNPAQADLSPVNLESLFRNILQLSDEPGTPALSIFWTMKKYPAAKRFLRAIGWPEHKVESLPALQIVLLADVAEYDRYYDSFVKWSGLPFAEARSGFDRAEHALKKHVGDGGSPGMSLSGLLLPAVVKVFEASNRIDRRIAALRTVEAIRLYAAEHGRLPAQLSEITAVPIPADPRTGEPFRYNSDGATATLIAPPPERERASVSNSLQYNITLRK